MTREEKVKGWASCPVFTSDYFKRLGAFVADERKKATVFPESDKIFRAFELTQPDKVKVILLGQDPYSTPGDATGLAFECGSTRITASWEKVLKVYDHDFPKHFSTDVMSGDLTRWANSGVLLMNSALTVRKGVPNSHAVQWRRFTKAILSTVIADESPKVFMIWGSHSRELILEVLKEEAVLCKEHNHLVLYNEHPAYAAYQGRDWDAKGVFLKVNEFLSTNNVSPIDW